MKELKVITVPWDGYSTLFDDEGLQVYIRDREVLAATPHFFTYEGRPCWSVFLETRPLREGDPRRTHDRPKSVQGQGGDPLQAASPGLSSRRSSRASIRQQLAELDEAGQARYARLVQWRRDMARQEGLPHFTILTNQQLVDVVRLMPRTLEGLAGVFGIGRKRVARYGRALLETLHGKGPSDGNRKPEALRGVDGHAEVAAGVCR